MSNHDFSLLMLVLVAAGVVALLVWFLLGLRRRPPPGGLPRHPVVLVHGIMGFDKINLGPLSQDYFRGVIRAMEKTGVRVYAPRLPALGSVPARAEALAAFIQSLPHRKVNIIAHSMGGLDARWAVSRLGIADRVVCLVTVATPHRGSPLADVAARKSVSLVRSVFSRFGAHTHAFDWLTSAGAERMNASAPDHPDVIYGSVVCRAGRRLWLNNPILYAPWLMMRRAHGESDGMVPAESQRWGTVWMEVEHDHWGQVGWSLWQDSNALYVRILAELAARGG